MPQLFQVAPSKIFRREGADIHSDLVISLSQAILGGTVKTPGIYEDVLLKVMFNYLPHFKRKRVHLLLLLVY